MYFGKKNSEEPVVIMEDTIVYACEAPNCKGWMRKEFSADNQTCPMCGGHLLEEIRELPKIQTEYNTFR
ncbi:cold-inducible protein YdjO-related protein [Peribacillus glennii]|uniref:Cold-shock protein n=1 Tax=Peribacillus glennii TaxID=2303991 RepID=A0A372LGB8_9BACI|nr:cold-inducible protein YdjO-related protein [Peribacillus glennii]RFU65353.1 hypothetical protein D0466_05515 [Peribacillus glennii]